MKSNFQADVPTQYIITLQYVYLKSFMSSPKKVQTAILWIGDKNGPEKNQVI